MNAALQTSICSGHGCFGPRQAVDGSPDVFINGIPVHRVTDKWLPHTCVSTHDSVLAVGSKTVFVNGLNVGRIGDQIACGSTIATGSDDVFIGE